MVAALNSQIIPPSLWSWCCHVLSFFIQFQIFSWIFGIMNDFLLKLGHLGYYDMRCWMLFKPSILAVFLSDTALTKKGRALPCCCQIGGEGQVAYSASVDAYGRQRLLITTGWVWELQVPIRPLLIPPAWEGQELLIAPHTTTIDIMEVGRGRVWWLHYFWVMVKALTLR